MQARVTAIIVARNGASHLERTLEALRRQTRQPDTVIAVDCGSSDTTSELLAAFGPTHLISADSDLSFGAAISAATRVMSPPAGDHELLWLLAQDSAPEPGALESLIGALEVAPSVAVAGPKVMEWVADDYIHDFGESMTPYGATVTLVESELDQEQHDGMSDVLAVSAGGMLVRHSVWDKLGGFDPALPIVDDSLDFCVRVRLAGHRVSVVAAARVSSAGDGVAGPDGSSRGRASRRRARAERSAQLHRRLVYAPAWALPVHWISLIPLAFLRAIGNLLRKEPGSILGEFAAAFAAAFQGGRVLTARRRLAATRTLAWSSISSLRVSAAEVRRRHALTREAALTGLRGDRPEIRFFAGGGAWTLLAAAMVGVAILAPLIGAQSLTGGGLLPLSSTVGALWANVGYGWRDIGLGFTGAADPFAVVLAVLGTITFWSPSFAMVLVYLLALPLAAVGAWMAATRVTHRGSIRAVAAVLWALSPTFLTALAAGRPAAIIVHLLLPWLFFAGFAAARSWSASGSAALLFAAIVACAPSLAPALLVGWLICVLVSGRSVMRFVGIPLPALALAIPLLWDQALRGNWLALLADPGVPVPTAPVPTWQFILGFPAGDFGGWTQLLPLWGGDAAVAGYLVPLLLIPMAVLALMALLLPGARGAALALVTALLGLGTAILAGSLSVAELGSQAVGIWPGAGLSLYWLGLVGAVVFAARGLHRMAIAPLVVTALALAVVSLPLAGAIPLGTSAVDEGIGRTQPAFVTAEAAVEPRVGTLQIVPQPDGGILATIVRGSGVRLDAQSTLNSTAGTLTDEQTELATLAGNLASQSGLDASADLAKFGIRFVLLLPAAAEPAEWGDDIGITQAASDTTTRTTTSLDGNAALAPVGDTAFGRLWRSDVPTDAAVNGQVPADAGGIFGLVTGLIAVFVIGATVLLSVPTGAGREAVRQAHREAIRRASRLSKPAKPTRVARPSRPARPRRMKRPAGRRAKGVLPSIEDSASPTPTEAPAEPAEATDLPSADTSSPKDSDHGN
ncbi:glycosyltransferase family 2 protein [Cryobacterium sp. TMT4-31]|uniref:glycosyltransferase family 2 protein n=1 Tax=Cryobacterium sp. TMT4-31 TaxID=1259259 RepID=UPI001069F7B4|nr:glycosyltransferase family 2 protein [Cryobacterium sp. TMT4-31]TFC88768.1 glycosyltransferase [Cryobacterium sp. TMT4-31]